MVEMRKKTVLIVLVILAFGLVGTGLSTLYKQNEYVEDIEANRVTVKVSYGFPLSWNGYSYTADIVFQKHTWFWGSASSWFSLESILLDATFWIAISFLLYFTVLTSVNMLHKTRASKKLSAINI
jgi:hypothetical protein